LSLHYPLEKNTGSGPLLENFFSSYLAGHQERLLTKVSESFSPFAIRRFRNRFDGGIFEYLLSSSLYGEKRCISLSVISKKLVHAIRRFAGRFGEVFSQKKFRSSPYGEKNVFLMTHFRKTFLTGNPLEWLQQLLSLSKGQATEESVPKMSEKIATRKIISDSGRFIHFFVIQ